MYYMYWYRKISKTSVICYFCIKRDREIKIYILCFSNVCSTSLHTYNRPTCVAILAKWKKSKENFHFNWKKTVKIALDACFAVSHGHPEQRVVLPNAFPGNYTQHQAAVVLNCECLHFILNYFVRLLARCVLK